VPGFVSIPEAVLITVGVSVLSGMTFWLATGLLGWVCRGFRKRARDEFDDDGQRTDMFD